jgi:predicted tellurium resistance membrane protein TerC
MIVELFTLDNLTALLTLTALEVVLGIDNIIFIAIVAARLPVEQRDKARRLGLSLAVITRLILLSSISWLMSLKNPFFYVLNHGVSGKDLILILGGLFLIAKSTKEIDHKLDNIKEDNKELPQAASFSSIISQILVIDIIFSLDSVITAVGMVKSLPVMMVAVIVSIGIMLLFSKAIVTFIEKNPTIKILALAFLIMVGVLLVAEGFHQEFDRGYIYFAMAFSLVVELINMKLKGSSIGTSKGH